MSIGTDSPAAWIDQFRAVRRQTEALCAPLSVEDLMIQSMPDASPAKWHLAHTTWFFETFLLRGTDPSYRPFDDDFAFLFNSYYNALGERIARNRRGMISRPSAGRVFEYRRAIDERLADRMASWNGATFRKHLPTLILGLNHEQQHQELILTDIQHAFGTSPLRPAYREPKPIPPGDARPLGWVRFAERLAEIGHRGSGFAFDNESPRHRVFLHAFELADRLVTNGEYLAFIEDRGYQRPEYWLSDGFDACRLNNWQAPEYWFRQDDRWWRHSLGGPRPVEPSEPVCHVSFYEADAFARWSSARLPTEAEWEVAAEAEPIEGNFVEDGYDRPIPAPGRRPGLAQLFGDAWEWTGSPYAPYPGFRPAAGALGEYNGKFMCNQMVLRGGSCATPRSHIRATYRNFFGPSARWQFSGIRLARDLR